MKDYLLNMVRSDAGKASGVTLILEAISSNLGQPGLGSAIGWALSGYFSKK